MTVIADTPPKSEVRVSDLIVYAGVGVLLSGGAILGCSTLWNLLRLHYFFFTTDLGVELSTTVAFLAAALLTLPIAWTANMVCSYPKSNVVLGVLVFLVCAALLVLTAGTSALLGLSQAMRSPCLLNASMHSAMDIVPVSRSVQKAFNYMQLEKGEKCVTPTFTSGCLRPALYELHYFVDGLSFLATTNLIVLAVILAAGTHSILQRMAYRSERSTYVV